MEKLYGLFGFFIGMLIMCNTGANAEQRMDKMWGDQVVVLRADNAERGQLFNDGNYAMFTGRHYEAFSTDIFRLRQIDVTPPWSSGIRWRAVGWRRPRGRIRPPSDRPSPKSNPWTANRWTRWSKPRPCRRSRAKRPSR